MTRWIPARLDFQEMWMGFIVCTAYPWLLRIGRHNFLAPSLLKPRIAGPELWSLWNTALSSWIRARSLFVSAPVCEDPRLLSFISRRSSPNRCCVARFKSSITSRRTRYRMDSTWALAWLRPAGHSAVVGSCMHGPSELWCLRNFIPSHFSLCGRQS